MEGQKGSKKTPGGDRKKGTPGNESKTIEIEKRRIQALYYLLNRGIPASKDELSYQQARQEFISLFPEFMEAAPEKFNPIIMNSEREKIRDILRNLPREKKIWEEELELRIQESVDLAHQAALALAQSTLEGERRFRSRRVHLVGKVVRIEVDLACLGALLHACEQLVALLQQQLPTTDGIALLQVSLSQPRARTLSWPRSTSAARGLAAPERNRGTP